MATLTKDINIGIHNKFDIEVIDAKTGELKQKAQAFNVICDAFYEKISSSEEYSYVEFADLAYGSGTGIPQSTDRNLFNKLSTKYQLSTYTNYVDNRSTQIFFKRFTFKIDSNESVGDNITELGFWNESYNRLFTHAMIQDMNGNTISILKTDTDIINIYATIYVHINSLGMYIYDGSGAGLSYKLVSRNNPIGVIISYLSDLRTYLSKSCCVASFGQGESGKTYYCTLLERQKINNKQGKVKIRIGDTKNNVNGGLYGLYFGGHEYPGYICLGDIFIKPNSSIIPLFHVTNESVGIGDGVTTKFKTKIDCPQNAIVYINGIRTNSVIVNKDSVLSWESNYQSNDCKGYSYYYLVNFNNISFPDDRGYNSSLTTSRSGQDIYGRRIRFCNHLYPLHGLIRLGYYSKLKGSNDGNNWIDIVTEPNDNWIDLPSIYYKYYELEFDPPGHWSTWDPYSYIGIDGHDGYNIIFDTPPAEGDVITIEYDTEYIPKDSDHVIDIEFNFTVGEYQGS